MKWWGWGAEDIEFDQKKRPGFFRYAKKMIGLDPQNIYNPIEKTKIQLPPLKTNPEFLKSLEAFFPKERIFQDNDNRLLHAYGKSFRDLFRARSGKIESAPDLVVYPESDEEILQLIQLANTHRVILIPFGGGTNIVGSLEVPHETRQMAVSVDLARMNRVLSLNQASLIAEVEAGVLGPHLEEQLNAQGYTFGHFPDSFEFSTLGGWIATRSAGMQSDVYGKIEDMVVSLTVVTPLGILTTPLVPKSATGPDLNQLVIGSEGIFGIITKAYVKIHPLKQHEYRGVLFPNFQSGVNAIHEMMRTGNMPVTTRLSNNDETQFGLELRSSSSSWKTKLESLYFLYLKKFKKIDLNEACLMILGFEGEKETIKRDKHRIYQVIKRYGGVDLGTSVGNKWFKGKYDYPYIRDLFMNYHGVADVTETSVTWDRVIPLYEHTYHVLKQLSKTETTPGYCGCHISHCYETGLCLYFTFAKIAPPAEALEVYWKLKKASVDAVLSQGGSLSHHHSIGYEHLPWMKDYLGKTSIEVLQGIKKAFDPSGILNPGKLLPK